MHVCQTGDFTYNSLVLFIVSYTDVGTGIIQRTRNALSRITSGIHDLRDEDLCGDCCIIPIS